MQMIDLMGIPAATKTALRKYFVDEWWCDKWRMAWLDVSRLRLIEGGQRTMTTNNHDENLNLQVADCIGSRRKKISTLVTELTGNLCWNPCFCLFPLNCVHVSKSHRLVKIVVMHQSRDRAKDRKCAV